VTVEQHEVVDFAAISADGRAALTISDHLSWEDVDTHLWHLQEKINGYLRFVESGEIYRKFPDMRGRQVVIDIALKYHPPETAHWFFEKSAGAIEKAGFKLGVRILSV
jgi:hypothetical protein